MTHTEILDPVFRESESIDLADPAYSAPVTAPGGTVYADRMEADDSEADFLHPDCIARIEMIRELIDRVDRV